MRRSDLLSVETSSPAAAVAAVACVPGSGAASVGGSRSATIASWAKSKSGEVMRRSACTSSSMRSARSTRKKRGSARGLRRIRIPSSSPSERHGAGSSPSESTTPTESRSSRPLDATPRSRKAGKYFIFDTAAGSNASTSAT